jgi:hypothetical protein
MKLKKRIQIYNSKQEFVYVLSFGTLLGLLFTIKAQKTKNQGAFIQTTTTKKPTRIFII